MTPRRRKACEETGTDEHNKEDTTIKQEEEQTTETY